MRSIIVKIDPFNIDRDKIQFCAEFIKKEKTVIFPTETVYGIGANALSENAVKKIFEAKGRPIDNPLIVHIADLKDFEKYAYIEKNLLKRIELFVPGPITFILPKKSIIPDLVTAKRKTVAIRFPSHPVALNLIKASQLPIAAPSANLSGKPSPTRIKHVIEDMKDRVDCIIDSGNVEYGLESTIVDLTKEKPVILRPGPIPPEKLEEIFGKIIIPDFAYGKKKAKEALAPGLKYKHYAPNKYMVLIEKSKSLEMNIKIVLDRFKKPIFLVTQEKKKFLPDSCDYDIIGKESDLFTVAYNLFDYLRRYDKTDHDVIVVLGVEDKGIGIAVMNRLRKAADEVMR